MNFPLTLPEYLSYMLEVTYLSIRFPKSVQAEAYFDGSTSASSDGHVNAETPCVPSS